LDDLSAGGFCDGLFCRRPVALKFIELQTLVLDSSCLVYNASMPLRAQGSPNAAKRGRTPPPEETFEEASFLKALGEKQKQVSVKLMDGQTVSGWIEYYDKYMIRLTREGVPNLFIFKHEIMYIAEDGGAKR
jgi:host factor-I protein